MTQTTIIGFPRLGAQRELKFATEKYFRNKISETELFQIGQTIRQDHWQLVKDAGIDLIPSNDFSFYDQVLDTAFLFNIIPDQVKNSSLSDLEKYFALARGYQGDKGDIKALPMKKWFHTNYHYLVPKFEEETVIQLSTTKIFDEFLEAQALGIQTRPVLIGPFTLLQLSDYGGQARADDFVADLVTAYQAVFRQLKDIGADWIQLDEPALVKDINPEEKDLFARLYQQLLADKADIKVLLQTYFGDVRDVYDVIVQLPLEAVGLDFVEGVKNVDLVASGFPDDKILHAGVVNGKNIWRNHYEQTLDKLKQLNVKSFVLSTSSSLLHVPISLENEEFPEKIKNHFAFAKEKLAELVDLKEIVDHNRTDLLDQNTQLFAVERFSPNRKLAETIGKLSESDFTRQPTFYERLDLQSQLYGLPLLPTTTIGSFPQTKEVKQVRARFKSGELTEVDYDNYLAERTNDWLKWQEAIGLDVLVHGEFERNDMVEYFGQNLEGYLFSKNGWVQSYGTRGVKPPIIWGDISRSAPITVKWSCYAQSQTTKLVKGMLTGPVTILNWSFPREDISIRESTLQIALAIQEEVLDLEASGIRIIQIDEAALREKLPLRKSDWYSNYLDWAIPAFRLVHSKVQPETQIHTHMCYSEFSDIISSIEQMDADVISFESSRSNLSLLDDLQAQQFKTQVGPGVYDIHSPRVPSIKEITETIHAILAKVPKEKVWINPDCGLKTRGEFETKASLENMIATVKLVREELS
ncbi:5-methyltetrahydropteroyltriglutamate--homocysteine S-methyltransferase [Jeotgalibaca sp. PTS2502]|uniref:5-methyltetrahydropteroyltriglutamate-- homocysteine S-methyltransferase n=1 Tax=Jeotgalibaca sp. PTS2502 TaxID=1903686 RepID=UPI000973B2D0|nr:5-methyltetrahydropteroyltriglutamate--homocysteine S-methyltransferase [Jeotgalibaca sp. PTS2502]APZ49272.1 5-methyltetrahydropteroyltriglutamate--homocysteine S-methyltransferase [Jeotgalibaca sp. PTS2502]